MTLEIQTVETKTIPTTEQDLRIFVPSMETFESEDAMRILLDIPGLDPNSISLQSDAGELVVQGLVGVLGVDLNSSGLRPCTRNFRESFQLNADLDDQNIEADFYDGTLQITIPRLFSENQDEFESVLVH